MDFAYARKSIEAAWQLAVRNEKAWNEFDLTSDGFFRSFAALLFVMPLNFLYDLFVLRLGETHAAGEGKVEISRHYGFAESLFSTAVLCIDWMIFPVLALVLVRFLDVRDRFVPFVIAHNWGRVVTELLNLPCIVLFAMGLISYGVAVDLLFINLGLTLYYRFYIAQTALGVGWGTAMGISILELLLSIMFTQGVLNSAWLWLR